MAGETNERQMCIEARKKLLEAISQTMTGDWEAKLGLAKAYALLRDNAPPSDQFTAS